MLTYSRLNVDMISKLEAGYLCSLCILVLKIAGFIIDVFGLFLDSHLYWKWLSVQGSEAQLLQYRLVNFLNSFSSANMPIGYKVKMPKLLFYINCQNAINHCVHGI